MKLLQTTLVSIWLAGSLVASQSLLDAISTYPQLSNFTALMRDNPALANALLTANATSLTGDITVLVPDNSAFTKVSSLYNISMSSLTLQQIEPFLSYQVMVGQYTSNNFTTQGGITAPTFLSGPQYNNRSAGAALGSSGANGDIRNGQVVFIQAKDDTSNASATRKFALRQLSNPMFNAQGGLGHQIVSMYSFGCFPC